MGTLPAWLLDELAELRERYGHAEGLAASRAEQLASMAVSHAEHTASLAASMALERASLVESLAKAEARADRLEAMLTEARKPALVRLVEALRRR